MILYDFTMNISRISMDIQDVSIGIKLLFIDPETDCASFGSFVPPTVGAVYAWATRTKQLHSKYDHCVFLDALLQISTYSNYQYDDL